FMGGPPVADVKAARMIEVPMADDGQRLDRWLKKSVPELPFALAQKLIRKGAIRIDGKKAKGDSRLSAGQQIRIPPVEDKPEREKEVKDLSADDAEFIRSIILYDDGDVIAFNKPAGLASQGGGGVEWHIDSYFPALADEYGQIPRLIHRLDRDTSGVLLCARTAQSVRQLGKSFKDRHARKIYWAITVNAPVQNEGTIRANISKPEGPHKDRMVIDDEGQTAVTDFVVLERAGKHAALVAFWPRTGRTHQIRVHAADVLKCPVMGDEKYGGAGAWLAGMDGLSERLHLHARQLTVRHPATGKDLVLIAPLPDDLRDSWDAFSFDPGSRIDPFAEI
ncbi:MAG: RluA family pseudouridine synthase, partial [Terriglobia bacterium]